MKRDNPELEAVYRTLSEKYGQTMTDHAGRLP